MPGDVVTVFSKTDVGAPAVRRPVVVSLEGEFPFAGVYQAQPGETLRQLVTRIGGLTPQAYLFGAEFSRESTRRDQEERLKQAIVQYEQDVQRAAATRARNVTSADEAAGLKTEFEAQQATVARLRTLRPTGRIVLEMPENPNCRRSAGHCARRRRSSSRPATPGNGERLWQGLQRIRIPVSAGQELCRLPSSSRRPAEERPTREACTSCAPTDLSLASEAPGCSSPRSTACGLMPGDAIVVPEDLTRTTWTKDLKDWTVDLLSVRA